MSTCNHQTEEVVEEGLRTLRQHVVLPTWAQEAMEKAENDVRKYRAKLAAALVDLEAARERERITDELDALLHQYLAARQRPAEDDES